MKYQPAWHQEASELIAEHGLEALNEALISALIAGTRGDLSRKGDGLAIALAVRSILGPYPRHKIDMNYVKERVRAATE